MSTTTTISAPPSRRGWRRLTAVAGAALLAVGLSVAAAPAASAAPADPITAAEMPDEGLRDAINAQLGNSAGDSFTEGDAAGLTTLSAHDRGISDLTGIEYLTGLVRLELARNDLDNADVAYLAGQAGALANLTDLNLDYNTVIDDTGVATLVTAFPDLTYLRLGATRVTDTGAATIASGMGSLTYLALARTSVTDTGAAAIGAGLTGLKSLVLGSTNVTDAGLTAIASGIPGLTTLWMTDTAITSAGAAAIAAHVPGMQYLYLGNDRIADISALASLTNLAILDLQDQTVSADPAVVDSATDNPIIDENGDPVAVTSSDPGFSYDAATDSWSFSVPGYKTLTWTHDADFGAAGDLDDDDVTFSGTIYQVVGVPLPAPTVEQECLADGTVAAPTVEIGDDEAVAGYQYGVNGEPADDLTGIKPGDEVVIVAWPEPGTPLVEGNGWERGSDGELISTIVIGEAPDCTVPTDETTPSEPAPTTPSEPADPTEPTEPTPTESSPVTTPADPPTTSTADVPAGDPDPADPSSTTIVTELSRTGPDMTTPLTIGLLLTAAGAGLLLLTRRRAHRH